MTNEELKAVAWAIREGCGLQGMEAEEAMHAFECAATPDVLLRLLADNERLTGCEDVLRQLASYVGAGGYNAPEVDPEVFARKILDGINILNDPLAQLVLKKGKEIEGLKADNDQLHGECNDHMETINALKAENEALRNGCSELRSLFVDATEQCCKAERERDALKAECEGLRKDAERYRWLRDGAGYCDTRDIPGMAPARMDAFIDAGIQQGGQSNG